MIMLGNKKCNCSLSYASFGWEVGSRGIKQSYFASRVN